MSMGGMSGGMGPGGGRGGGRGAVSSGDTAKQKELNSEAPKIANLGGRIAELFKPYRSQLTVISLLVLVSAALGIDHRF